MYRLKTLSYLVASFACFACASAPDTASLPSWCERAGLGSGPEQTVYVGRADGASNSEQALELATANALAQLTQELGITVSTESSLVQSETNGRLNTEVRAAVNVASREVEIRGMRLTKTVTATLTDGETGCVRVEIAAPEKARLERLARNRSSFTVHCTQRVWGW